MVSSVLMTVRAIRFPPSSSLATGGLHDWHVWFRYDGNSVAFHHWKRVYWERCSCGGSCVLAYKEARVIADGSLNRVVSKCNQSRSNSALRFNSKQKEAGSHNRLPALNSRALYLVQPQISHSHVSQVQVSPVQFGHSQPTHLQPVLAHAAVAVLQQPRLHEAAGLALVIAQPHEPHSQVSHEQVTPLQSGHWQSTQAHPD